MRHQARFPCYSVEFWPKFQPGVFIKDTIAKKQYVTPGSKQVPIASSDVSVTPVHMISTQAKSWTTWGTSLSLGLGITLLVVGFLARRRVRQTNSKIR